MDLPRVGERVRSKQYGTVWKVIEEKETWLPGVNDLRTIPLDYDRFIFNKVKEPEKKKHITHKAIELKQKFDDGIVASMSEIARIEGLTRARVTQIMNLLKLPAEMQDFLLGLDDAKLVRKYSERKLRGNH